MISTRFLNLTIVSSILIITMINDFVSTECCDSNDRSICGDGTKGTPCCGYRRCNLFCCNCDKDKHGHVCRFRRGFRVGEDSDNKSESSEIIMKGDLNNDNRLSLDEAEIYLDHNSRMNKTHNEIFSELKALDLNNDGYLSPEEIDPQE